MHLDARTRVPSDAGDAGSTLMHPLFKWQNPRIGFSTNAGPSPGHFAPSALRRGFAFQEIQKRNSASETSISSTMEVIDPESSGLTNDVSGRLSFFTKGDDQGPKNEECASALATPSKVPPAAAMHMFCHVSMQQEYAYEYGVCMRIRTHSLTGPVMQSRAWGCCAYVGNAGVRT